MTTVDEQCDSRSEEERPHDVKQNVFLGYDDDEMGELVIPVAPRLMRGKLSDAASPTKDDGAKEVSEAKQRRLIGFRNFAQDVKYAANGTEWILPFIAPAGRPAIIGAMPKTGKTLLMLELSVRACLGLHPLDMELPEGDSYRWAPGEEGNRPPVDQRPRIGFLDGENSYDLDIIPWLKRMDYDLGELGENFAWHGHADFAPLNTAEGADQAIEWIRAGQFDLVVVDTMSAFVVGNEKDSTPYNDLSRNLLRPLKQGLLDDDGHDLETTAVVFLDHLASRTDVKAFGSSAKNRHFDILHTLKPAREGDTENFKLTCVHSRGGGIAGNVLDIRRTAESSPEPLRHVVSIDTRSKDAVRATQGAAAVPDDATAQRVLVEHFAGKKAGKTHRGGYKVLRAAGITGRTEVLNTYIDNYNRDAGHAE